MKYLIKPNPSSEGFKKGEKKMTKQKLHNYLKKHKISKNVCDILFEFLVEREKLENLPRYIKEKKDFVRVEDECSFTYRIKNHDCTKENWSLFFFCIITSRYYSTNI